MARFAASCFEALQDLFFPPLCLGCGRRLNSSLPPLFCSDCLAEIEFLASPCCSRCGFPFPAGVDHLCGDCLAQSFAFDFSRSLFHFQPPVSPIIHSLKFGGQFAGLATLAALAAQSPFLGQFAEPDLLLPVPLHIERLRERGFNQALVIAKGCFPQWASKIVPDLLSRSRSTAPQSLLSGKERRVNLKGVFTVARPSRLVGKKVLLVDDVLTTGSTVNECSQVLVAAGAARVEVFTLARSLVR